MSIAHKHASGRFILISCSGEGNIYPVMSDWWKSQNPGMDWCAGTRVSNLDEQPISWFRSYSSRASAKRFATTGRMFDR
jgi:hypothetical protein